MQTEDARGSLGKAEIPREQFPRSILADTPDILARTLAPSTPDFLVTS